MNREHFIPVILGPTASGKTSVGIELSKLIDGEVISIDSRKVYKGLAVGTATPAGEWKSGVYRVQGVPHYLMSFLAPETPYTAGDFSRQAEFLIDEIKSRGKTPILVGGTGFYFKALEQGLPLLPERDRAVRQTIETRINQTGVEAVHAELKRMDPQAAGAITTRDRHKIIRAMEIYELTGRPFSDWKNKKKPSAHRFRVMGLDFNKALLDRRIEERSRRMLKNGMIEEALALLKAGVPADCPALSSFGYKEAVGVIEGRLRRPEFLTALIKGTKAYAKRQRTWFRTQIQPAWFMLDETSSKEAVARRIKEYLDSEMF